MEPNFEEPIVVGNPGHYVAIDWAVNGKAVYVASRLVDRHTSRVFRKSVTVPRSTALAVVLSLIDDAENMFADMGEPLEPSDCRESATEQLR